MEYPINLKYVKPFDINVAAVDGTVNTLTVLSFDKKGNEEYWKILYCFSDLINKLELTNAEEAKTWTISVKPFSTHPAMIHLTAEQLQSVLDGSEIEEIYKLNNISPILIEIYGIPVNWIDDQDDVCQLTLNNDQTFDTHWK